MGDGTLSRMVKEWTTKESYPVEQLYKGINSRGNVAYFFSEEDYKKYISEIEYMHKITEFVAYDILGFKTIPGSIGGLIGKKVNELKPYTYEVIYETFLKCAKSIESAMRSKNFKSDWNRLAYIFAIIANNINDVNRQISSQKAAAAKEAKLPEADDTDIGGRKPEPKPVDYLGAY